MVVSKHTFSGPDFAVAAVRTGLPWTFHEKAEFTAR